MRIVIPGGSGYLGCLLARSLAAGQRLALPATTWMLELGSFFLRTESELILKSRRVVPRRLLEAGFKFQISDWAAAARELCSRRMAA